MTAARDAGSFRDPSGHVYLVGARVLRTVTERARGDYEQARGAGVFRDLIGTGALVDFRELAQGEAPPELSAPTAAAAYVLELQRIPFVSHPYEWSFSLLKAAALAHLDLQLTLLDRGFKLIDATAYNIQFLGPRPIFIDHLSVRPYVDGELWLGHQQFCQQFVNPLLLRAKCGIAHNGWFRGNLEGISTRDLARILPASSRLSWNTLTHVLLQARLERRAIEQPGAAIAKAKGTRRISKLAFGGMLRQMRNWLASLHPADTGKTVWGEYAHSHTYSGAEAEAKRRFISEFAAQVRPGTLVDLGCNTGDYSIGALEGGATRVVGFDFDQTAIDTAYARAIAEQRDFLPLWLDAANPSPDQGWNQAERRGLAGRMPVDAVIALAFEHHLAIARNVPLPEVVDWIVAMAPTGVIEFVPKSDETVQRMLALREDVFSDYTEDAFVSALLSRARIVESREVSNSGRIAFWYDRK
jgi:ribosomal protein L11 methylase PrmA